MGCRKPKKHLYNNAYSNVFSLTDVKLSKEEKQIKVDLS